MVKKYHISKKEYFINILMIVLFIFIIAQVFYGSFAAGIILLPLSIPIIKWRKQKIYLKKEQKLEIQFKDMLLSMADAMKTGYSVENAIRESYKDMLTVYGHNSDICIEQRLMISRLKFNINAEMVIENFAERTGLENARMFSQIFSVAKKTGGNMSYVIASVADNIKLKESVKEEINIVISAKKFEQKIMTIIPVFLVVYVSVASPGFLDIMYQTWVGRIIMTGFVICYITAFIWSEKISEIKI